MRLKRAASLLLPLLAIHLSGCAMQRQVQRETIEYNSVVYGMANQLTLLNIARASRGLPTSYTSISRLSGTITVKAAAGFGAQIKDSQPVTTSSTSNQVASTGGTSTAPTGTSTTGSLATTAASLLQTAVTRGGNIYTPTVSGEVDSGPSFDIEILDTQAFYRGILSSIDGQTLLNFVDQGIDRDIIFRLLVSRVVFKAAKDFSDPTTGMTFVKGQVVHTWTNAPPAVGTSANAINSSRFWPIADCYSLASKQSKGEDAAIARVDHIALAGDGRTSTLHLSDLATIDGTQLALKPTEDKKEAAKKDIYIGSDKVPEQSLLIVKPAQAKEVAALYAKPNPPNGKKTCAAPAAGHASAFDGEARFIPSADTAGSGDADMSSTKGALEFYPQSHAPVQVQVDVEIDPRSTEAVVQFLGAYIHLSAADINNFEFNGQPFFEVKLRCGRELAGVDLAGVHYCIDDDETGAGARSMQILALVEQLIDLNKSGADRPSTVPVQVLP